MPPGLSKRTTVRHYEIDGRAYTARRVMSAHPDTLDWAVLDEHGLFLFLIHYCRTDRRYRLHGCRFQKQDIGDAIRAGVKGHYR